MKAIFVIRSTGSRSVSDRDSVQQAIEDGTKVAMAEAGLGRQNVTLEIYELVSSAPVVTTHTISLESVVKP